LGSGKGTSKSTQAPPKEIMDAYRQSLDLGRQAIQQPYQQYQGQMVAGLNPTQLQGLSNVNAAQGAALPYIQQGAGYVNQAAQGVNPQMINQFMSPYLNNVVNATQKNLLESNAQQLAGLKGQAIQSGAFGGDRSRFAQAELARQQGLAGGQVIGGLLNQGYGQALTGAQQNVQNMMQGGNMLGALGQSAQQSILQGAQAQMAAGAQQQATEQAGLQAMYDQFLQRQSYPYQQAQFYANIAQGIGAGAGGTTSQTPAAPSFGSQILGGLTAIGSIFGPSDERIKENIKPVGKTNDGQTIYKYNFKGSPKTEIGLIAQEVEQRNPEAVASLGGIKMVDYDKATEGAERQGKSLGGSSMGGLVTPDMQRQAFAQGGFGMVPYADFMKGISYIPSGELTYRGHSPGSTLPEGYKMEDLRKMAEGSSFDELNAMSEKDIANLEAGFGKIGKSLGLSPASDGADGVRASTFSGPLSNFGPSVTNFFSGVGNALGFADGGGVVPRQGYEEGGMPLFLRKAESGDDFSADNNLGYVGRGQFGEARLLDAKRAGVIPPDLTMEQFKSDPEIQKAVEAWHVSDVNNYIKSRGLGEFVGQKINDIPVTDQGLLAVAHLGGKGGMRKFLQSSGEYDPADVNGTKLSDYLRLASNVPGGVAPEVAPADVSGVAPTVDMPAVNALAIDAPEVSGVVPPMQDVVAQAQVSPVADKAPARKRTIIESILNQDMSDQARTGMLAAGLAMLGGTSPYAGVNIGKGGLAGLQAYYKGLENQRETAVKRADIERTLAEAASIGATTEEKNMAVIRLLQRLYLKAQANAQLRNEAPPSWEEFLSEQGFGGRGWEMQDPNIFAPAQPDAPALSNETPAAEELAVPGEETATEEEPPAPQAGMADPVFEQAKMPSSVVKPVDENFNLKKVRPEQNPFILMMGDEEERALGQKILDQGYTMDATGQPVYFRGGEQIKREAEKAAQISADFGRIQQQNPLVKNVVDKISAILRQEGSDKLTTLRGEISGLLVSLNAGSEEELQNATTSDLLTKLYKQLSLMSELQGAATTAGIDKIRQVEQGSGSPTLVGPAAREIIGNLTGQLKWQSDMAADWGRFVEKHSNTGVSSSMESKWVQMWNAKLPEYSEWGMANTPVADANLFKTDERNRINLNNFKTGWKYVFPNGKIAVYTGKPEDKYFKVIE
jgi:hypothetical protein